MNIRPQKTISIVLLGVVFMASGSPCDAGILKTLAKAARGVAGKMLGESAEAGSKSASRVLIRQTDDAVRMAVRSSDDLAKAAAKSADDVAAVGANKGSKLFRPGGAADDVAAFATRNKGAIAGGAVVATLITSPDAVLGAAGDTAVGLAGVAGTSIATPLIETAGEVVAPLLPLVVINTMWAIFAGLMIGLVIMCWRHQQDVNTFKKESDVYAGVVELKAESKPTLLSRWKLWQHK